MGAVMSLIPGGGTSSTKWITNWITNRAYDKFKNAVDFDQFHIIFLEVLTQVNASMPGVHRDVPSKDVVKEYYEDWKTKTEERDRKDLLKKFLEMAEIRKTDNTMLATGLIAPPAAMIGKKTAEGIPTLNVIKIIPDVAFVPTVTLAALVGVKFFYRPTPTTTSEKKPPPTQTNPVPS